MPFTGRAYSELLSDLLLKLFLHPPNCERSRQAALPTPNNLSSKFRQAKEDAGMWNPFSEFWQSYKRLTKKYDALL